MAASALASGFQVEPLINHAAGRASHTIAQRNR